MADRLDPDLLRLLSQTVGDQAPSSIPKKAVPPTYQTAGCVQGPPSQSDEDEGEEVEVSDRLMNDVAFQLQSMMRDLTTEKPDLRSIISEAVSSAAPDVDSTVRDAITQAVLTALP